ncbi:MAG: hydrolase [Rhodoglobus sp.]|nr:hydrolase [Rhodoglobus sp.]
MRDKPWDGLIPDQDLAAFAGGFDSDESRPMAVGSKPALVIVDMTRAFVDSAYPKGWGETGWPAVAANERLLAAARDAGAPVFFTQAYPWPGHNPRSAERGNWRFPPGPTPTPDLPPGDVIVDQLTPRPEEIVLFKGSKSSAFFGTPLIAHLIHAGVDTVIVTGMTTSGCVRATVIDAFSYNLRVIVPVEAVADRSQLSHRVNLFDIHMKYGDVVSLQESLDYLARLEG